MKSPAAKMVPKTICMIVTPHIAMMPLFSNHNRRSDNRNVEKDSISQTNIFEMLKVLITTFIWMLVFDNQRSSLYNLISK